MEELTSESDAAFQNLTRKEAADELLRRDLLPTWDQASTLQDLMKQCRLPEDEQHELWENAIKSKRDMQNITNALIEAGRHLKGQYVH